jgi:hypothetical protein
MKSRKRLYINEERDFQHLFSHVNVEEMREIVTEIEQKGSYKLT